MSLMLELMKASITFQERALVLITKANQGLAYGPSEQGWAIATMV
jgi:hypothetical protein